MDIEMIDGPEWLDSQADRLNAQNHDAEARQARRLAKEWQSDRSRIDQLQEENSQLQRDKASLERRIANTLCAAQGLQPPV